jgi:hypothetical protein
MLLILSPLASGNCHNTCHKADKTYMWQIPEKGLRGGRAWRSGGGGGARLHLGENWLAGRGKNKRNQEPDLKLTWC